MMSKSVTDAGVSIRARDESSVVAKDQEGVATRFRCGQDTAQREAVAKT